MKVFTLNKIYSIACEFEETKQGFKHIATLLKNGCGQGNGETVVRYLNRTWECFEYETVLKKCIDNNFCKGTEHDKFINQITKGF